MFGFGVMEEGNVKYKVGRGKKEREWKGRNRCGESRKVYWKRDSYILIG